MSTTIQSLQMNSRRWSGEGGSSASRLGEELVLGMRNPEFLHYAYESLIPKDLGKMGVSRIAHSGKGLLSHPLLYLLHSDNLKSDLRDLGEDKMKIR